MGSDAAGWRVILDVSDAEVQEVLEQDRVWNCFALADLAPPFRAYSRYAIACQRDTGESAACLVLAHPALTVLSPYGPVPGVAALLAQLDLPKQPLIQAQEAHLPPLRQYYQFLPGWRELLRMAVSVQTFVPPATAPDLPIERLSPTDLPALTELYALSPENHFRADMLEHGLFYGARAGKRVIAAGGTHVMALASGIAVLGNILTHPDARRRGCATAITAALVSDLLARGCRDVVLNVVAENPPAVSIYTHLGFQTHARFWTGQAERNNEA